MDMKFWQGLFGTPKEGFCGTCDDTDFVPDSIEIGKEVYDAWIALQPVPPAKPDYAALFTAAATVNDKIDVLARNAGLK